MKILLWILGIVLFILTALYTLLFTDFGNSITKPYIEKIIKEKTGYDVRLDHFDLNLNDFEIKASVNNEIFANTNGAYSLIGRNFDLSYELDIKNLASFGLNLDQNMQLKGRVAGDIEKFGVNGAGNIFDSDVEFMANLDNFMPLDLKIDAKNLNVEKILTLANQPIYAKGSLDIIADVVANNNNPSGTANIKSQNLILNSEIFKEFPKNFAINLNSDINIKDAIATANSLITTKVAKITAKRSEFDLKNKNFKSDFSVNAANLADLAFLTGQQITGDFTASGDIKSDLKTLEITGASLNAFNNAVSANIGAKYDLNSKDLKAKTVSEIKDFAKLKALTKTALNGSAKAQASFDMSAGELKNLEAKIDALGGKMDINGDIENLKIIANNLKIAVISSFLGLDTMANGDLNLDALLNLSDMKKIGGNLNFSVKNGVAYKNFLDKTTGKNFPSDLKFALKGDAKIQNSIINFTTKTTSDLINLDKFDGSYDINSASLDADYILGVASLERLEFLLGRKLIGEFRGSGKITQKAPNLKATINSDIFKGKLAGDLTNENLTLKLTNSDVKSITDMLEMEHIYDGICDGDVVYNTKNRSGKFDAIINNGKLVSSGLLANVSKFLGRDLANEVYNNAKIDGTIKQDIITFNAEASAKKSNISIENGVLNSANSNINIPIKANIEKTDLEILATGTTKNPKYSISSQYIKTKIEKELGRGIDKLLGVKKDENSTGNLDNKQKADDIKNIIKGIGDLF